jgi:RNA-directed DNA polymerase
MTTVSRRLVHSSTSPALAWQSIDWDKAHREVRRLQMRIAKAVQEGRYGKVQALQWTLTHSFHVRQLTDY